MIDNNSNKGNSKASNDISEMLRLLRESVDNDKKNIEEQPREVDAEITKTDEEIRTSLEKVFEDTSLDTEIVDDGEDEYFEDEDEAPAWFSLEDDDDDTLDADMIEIIDGEDEPEEEEAGDEIEEAEEEVIEESVEEFPEEDPDDDSPWYSDEAPEAVSEVELEEAAAEEVEEIEEVDEAERRSDEQESPVTEEQSWYTVETNYDDTEEPDEIENNEEISLDDESIWYEQKQEDDLTDEFYQDEEFVDEDSYDESFEDELFSEASEDTEVEDTPENDYSEENVYIYDATQVVAEDYLEAIASEKVPDESEEIFEDEDEYEDEQYEDEKEVTIDETDRSFLNTLGIAVSEDDEGSSGSTDDSQEQYSGDISYDYEGGEYVLENQKNEISSGYKHEKKRILVRLIISSVAALLLFFYEMMMVWGVDLPGLFDYKEFPLSYILISVQLLVVASLVCLKQLYVGISDLIYRRATPYSVSAIIVLVNFVYSIIIAIVLPEGFGIYNFVGAFAVVAGVVYEYLLIVSEDHIFSVFSSKKGQKYVFVKEDTDFNDSTEGGISLTAAASEFNKNYFLRMRKRSVDYKYLTYAIVSVLGASILVFVISLICKTGGTLALQNGILLLNFSLPLGVLGAFSYPVFRASVKALGKRGAIVGGASVDEYSKTRFVTFGEEELFSSLKTTHLDLKPAGNNNISEVLCKTSMLLSAIGGPMKRMVEVMQADFVGDDVYIDEVFDDGISAIAADARMLAGSPQFLRQHGVEVDEQNDFNDVDDTNEVLYISIDGKLAARYYLKYKADMEFVKLVNALGNRGISVGIRTRNPSINSDIIARRCPEMKYKVYTIKGASANEGAGEAYGGVTDSGLVATGKALSLAYPLLACCDLKKYYKVDMFIRIASAVVGGIFVVATAIMGRTLNISIFNILIYQLVWLLPSLLFGLLHFKHRSKRKKNKIVYR